ncbi:MAG: glycosyltransferase [Rhodobacteraceae bacterium]|nr:glycosyltransferase [Paracoccaceae bacterium]
MSASHAVIIPHYNDADRLMRCLRALAPAGLEGAEVIVVDNGSTQSLDAIRAAFPNVAFVTEPNKGAANARNRGVRETTAERLVFLDADCVPQADWFAAIRRETVRADIIGGAIDVFDETPPPRSGAEAFETVFAFNYKDYIEKKGFSVTANLVTSRSVFLDVGDFIDGLSEDAEWCLRAGTKGYRVALDETIRVAHPTRSDWAALVRKWRRITAEMYGLHMNGRGRGAGALGWAARALVMALSSLPHLPRLLFSPRLDTLGERLRGAAVLIRLRLLRSYWMLRQAFGFGI